MFAPSRSLLPFAVHRTSPALSVGAAARPGLPGFLHRTAPAFAPSVGRSRRSLNTTAHKWCTGQPPPTGESANASSAVPPASPSLHEDVFVSNARRAFDSLWGSPAAAQPVEASSTEGADETRGGEEGGTDEAASSELRLHDLGSVTAAPCTYADDEQPTHRKEEGFAFIAAEATKSDASVYADVGATDATGVDEGTSVPPIPSQSPRGLRSPTTASGSLTGTDTDAEATASEDHLPEPKGRRDGRRRASSCSGAAAGGVGGVYTPVNLGGTPYQGDLAATLRQAAHAKGFVSPVWATKDSLSTHHVPITSIVDGEDCEGVVITDLQYPFTLYNLEQTDLAPALTHTTDASAIARWVKRQQKRTRESRTPRNLLGSYLRRSAADVVRTHPRYAELQPVCPLWITAMEVRKIGAKLRDEEKGDYALEAIEESGLYAASRREFLVSHPQEQMNVQAQSRDLGVDLTKYRVYYNVHQLADRERFHAGRVDPQKSHKNGGSSESGNDKNGSADNEAGQTGEYDGRFFRCVSHRGRRYGTAISFLMREYCRRYHFPHTGLQLWVTDYTLKKFGGRFLATLRTPRDAAPSQSRRNDGTLFITAAFADDDDDGGVTEEEADAALSGAAVVPPPFTALGGEDILVLYNAEHTDIKDLLWGEYRQYLRSREDFYRERGRYGSSR